MDKVCEYKECYVAFLDILGFKEHLKLNSCEDIFTVFNALRDNTHSKMNLNGAHIEAYDHIKHTILSDSVVVYIEADIEDSFSTLVAICRKLQKALANRDDPILLRGGIAKGDLFWDEGIIYGEGLVKAYLMESKLAKYPRIVFSGETLEAGRQNTKFTFPELDGISRIYSTDEDCLNYVNYFNDYFLDANDGIRFYDGLMKLCSDYLNKEIDHALREKYLWLKRKIESAIECHSYYKDYYKMVREQENEKAFKEYNARFEVFPTRLEAKLEIK